MGCGSSDAEGGSPKASQAINDSFPPFSPASTSRLPWRTLEKLCHIYIVEFGFCPSVFKPNLSLNMSNMRTSCLLLGWRASRQLRLKVCYFSLFPSKCFVQLWLNTKDLIDFTFCTNGATCVSDAFVRSRSDCVCGGRRLVGLETTTTLFRSSSPGGGCRMIISENAVSSSTSDYCKITN